MPYWLADMQPVPCAFTWRVQAPGAEDGEVGGSGSSLTETFSLPTFVSEAAMAASAAAAPATAANRADIEQAIDLTGYSPAAGRAGCLAWAMILIQYLN
jgi:hypothetical protein